MNETIFIAGVSERDIDLLLLEEFMADVEFCAWFVAKAGLGMLHTATPVEAKRSVTSSSGESDLLIKMIRDDGTQHLLLIENKVSAGFQPAQAQRYQQRGRNYIAQGDASGFTTILVAPAAYFKGDNKGFDARVNYEAIKDWFASAAAVGKRRGYKLSLLNSAIERSSLGYQQIPNDAVTQFWHDYWLLTSKIAPELRLEKPGTKPGDSTFVVFRGAQLTPKAIMIGYKLRVVHKLTHGHFDVEIGGKGNQLPELQAEFGALLYKGLELVKAHGSAAIRAYVPKLNVVDDFELQKAAATEGIQEGLRLYHWIKNIIESDQGKS